MIPKAVGPTGLSPASVPRAPEPLSVATKAAIRRRLIGLAIVAGLLVLAYGQVLVDLVGFSLADDLFSYIPLIPLVCGYLVWDGRKRLQLESEPSRRLALIPLGAGLLLLGYYWVGKWTGGDFEPADYLALTTSSLYCLLFAACGWFLGSPTLRAIAFPAGFMIFAVPQPVLVHDVFQTFLQYVSAYIAYGFIVISGTAVLREGLIFQLPGINIEVAPECSAIHATLVFIITGVLAAYLFLRTPGRRILLVASVLPFALVRNGFRIWVISELCVHISPDMINSYIHRHGGPIFFVLFLIPFFFWLRFLHRSESRPTTGRVRIGQS